MCPTTTFEERVVMAAPDVGGCAGGLGPPKKFARAKKINANICKQCDFAFMVRATHDWRRLGAEIRCCLYTYYSHALA